MENYFIINPAAGNKSAESFIPAIEAAGQSHIHITTDSGGAETFVRKLAEPGRPCRFYIVGGDGTLNEAVNGAFGCDNVQIGLIPAGTGNDFVRCFKNRDCFKNIDAQLAGKTMRIDTIKAVLDGKKETRFVNMANVGFDCNVVISKNEMKRRYSAESSAYFIGVFHELAKNYGQKIRAEFDDGFIYDDCQLLCTIANGRYCGGGFCSSPEAELSDGMIDVCVINKIGRLKLLSFFKKYHDGTYLDDPKADNIFVHRKTKRFAIELEEESGISIDGEIYYFKRAEFEAESKKIAFIVPDGADI